MKELTENEKLKEICDKIWFTDFTFEEKSFTWPWYTVKDIREIIFTPEFQDRLWFYLIWTKGLSIVEQQKKQSAIVFYTNDPVSYLYNLIK